MTDLENILQKIDNVHVIAPTISYKKYIAIDLSPSNKSLETLETSSDFENFISDYLVKNNAEVAYGGYNETRNLYKRSSIFNDDTIPERNIHIGLDLWIKAGTPVLAALDGKVHSINFNTGLGNYGPTIILEHTIENILFYTLYGHLSLESIEAIEIGDVYKKGEQIALLGDASVNGDYAPHLHFQIIKDIQNNFGDYPGVCAKDDLKYYLENCPDPNFLLKIK